MRTKMERFNPILTQGYIFNIKKAGPAIISQRARRIAFKFDVSNEISQGKSYKKYKSHFLEKIIKIKKDKRVHWLIFSGINRQTVTN